MRWRPLPVISMTTPVITKFMHSCNTCILFELSHREITRLKQLAYKAESKTHRQLTEAEDLQRPSSYTMQKTAACSSPLPNALGAAAELLAAALAAFPAAAHALAHRRRTRRQRHVLALRLDPQWAYVNAVLRSQHVHGTLQDEPFAGVACCTPRGTPCRASHPAACCCCCCCLTHHVDG